MSNFEKVGAAKGPRTELHNTLHLTGAEISINNLPAGEVYHLFIIIKRTKRSILLQLVQDML